MSESKLLVILPEQLECLRTRDGNRDGRLIQSVAALMQDKGKPIGIKNYRVFFVLKLPYPFAGRIDETSLATAKRVFLFGPEKREELFTNDKIVVVEKVQQFSTNDLLLLTAYGGESYSVRTAREATFSEAKHAHDYFLKHRDELEISDEEEGSVWNERLRDSTIVDNSKKRRLSDERIETEGSHNRSKRDSKESRESQALFPRETDIRDSMDNKEKAGRIVIDLEDDHLMEEAKNVLVQSLDMKPSKAEASLKTIFHIFGQHDIKTEK